MRHSLGQWTRGVVQTVALGCLILSTLPGTAVGAVATDKYLGMRVTLALSKTEIVAGEPLFLKIHVLNEDAGLRVGNFAAKLYMSEGNDIRITVQPPGELPFRYQAAEEPGVYSGVEIDLNNGEAFETSALMLYERNSPNGYLFGKPGVYTVSAALSSTILRDTKPFVVQLPPTQIVVRAPEGAAAKAFDLIDEPPMARALQVMDTSDKSLVERARRVVAEFPDSPYTPLCRMMSALAWYRSEPPQIQQASAEIQEFLKRHPDHTRAADAAFLMVVLGTVDGQTELARDWFFFVRDAWPDYEMMRQKNYYADLYYNVPAEEAAKRAWWMYERPWIVPGAKEAAAARQRGQ